jgi:hypothetical protein
MERFDLEGLVAEARIAGLDPSRRHALESALEKAGGFSGPLREFLLPFAAAGLDAAQMLDLLGKVPPGWPLSHREMYYDFRLARWQKHLEPPTLADLLEEYLASAPSREEGLAYLKEEWRQFLVRHQGF